MRKFAERAFLAADLAWAISMIVTGAVLIAVGSLPIWN